MMYCNRLRAAEPAVHSLATVAGLLRDLQSERLTIPGVTRLWQSPRWSQARACSFLDSLYRGYPAGSILLWLPERDYRPGEYRSWDHMRQHLVVDGTYRLATLAYYLRPGVKDQEVIAFHPASESFVVTDESIREDPEYVQQAHMLCGHEADAPFWIIHRHLERLRESREVSVKEEEHIVHTLTSLQRIAAYRFPVMCLGENYTEEHIAELRARLHAGRE